MTSFKTKVSLLTGGLILLSTAIVATLAQASPAPLSVTLRPINDSGGAEGAGFGVAILGAESNLSVTLNAPTTPRAYRIVQPTTVRFFGTGITSWESISDTQEKWKVEGIKRNDDQSIGFNGTLAPLTDTTGLRGLYVVPKPIKFDVAVADLQIAEHPINSGDGNNGVAIPPSGSGTMTLKVRPTWAGPSTPAEVGTVTFSVEGAGAQGIDSLYDGATQVFPGNGVRVPKDGLTGKQITVVTNANFASLATIKATFAWDPLLVANASAVTAVDQVGVAPYLLEIVDAQAFGPDGGPPRLTGNVTADVDPSWLRVGAFADGTSVLVIRLRSTIQTQGDVTFEVKHNEEDETTFPQATAFTGSLSTAFPTTLPAPDAGGDSRTAMVVAGQPLIVYYRPPNNFRFGCKRYYEYLTITAKSGNNQLTGAAVKLVRPSIIMAHGFISSPQAMTPMVKLLQYVAWPGFREVKLDWSDMNTSGYDVVPARFYTRIAEEVQIMRACGIAATRVDLFGHSMGGAIAKWYVSDMGIAIRGRRYGFEGLNWNSSNAPCHRSNNFGLGDIRRLVTVGSPFQGSPLADGIASVGSGVLTALINNNPFGITGNGRGIEDLGIGGAGTWILTHLQPQPAVSWCPIIGRAAPTKTDANLAGSALAWLLQQTHLTPEDVGLVPTESDLVVERFSQRDAHSLPAGKGFSVNDVVHTSETESDTVAGYLAQALDLFYDQPPSENLMGYTYFLNGF